MRSNVLHALANVAQRNGQDASTILRELAHNAEMQSAIDNLRTESEGWQRAACAREKERGDEQDKRMATLAALGDGWHPLKCGGAVFLEGGKPVRLRDGGEHTEERHERTLEETQALGFQWLECALRDAKGNGIWSDDGETTLVSSDYFNPPF